MNVISQLFSNTVLFERLGWTIMHSLWQIGILAFLLLLFRKWKHHARTAVFDYWSACIVMVLMIVAPVVTFCLIEPLQLETTHSSVRLDSVGQQQIATEMVLGTSESNFLQLPHDSPNKAELSVVPVTKLNRVTAATETASWSRTVTGAIANLMPIVAMVWLVGVILFSVRPLAGIYHVRRLRRSAIRDLTEPLSIITQAAVHRSGLKRAVDFAVSKMVNVPTVVGSFRPLVLLPLSVVTDLSPAQLESIILHELAHVRRGDYAMNLLQSLIELLLFYHPCVWWVSDIIRDEREHCCDDFATTADDVRDYALALMALERSRSRCTLVLEASGGKLLPRVRRMLQQSAAIRTGDAIKPSNNNRAASTSLCSSLIALATLAAIFVGGSQTLLLAGNLSLFRPQQSAAKSKPDNPAKIRTDFSESTMGKVLDKEMEKLKQIGFNGCVLVAHHGEIILVKSAGAVDLAGATPIKPPALFELASLSKSFTSVAVMKLAEQGKLVLDASIDKYLPGVPENCREITVRHLLQHTSGIPAENYGDPSQDLTVAVQTMLQGGPKTEPGSTHLYWNQGFILLSEIIVAAAKKPFVDVVREQIFEPADMTGTCFTGDSKPDTFVATMGSGKLGPPRSCLEHPYGKFELIYQGAGGVVSNVFDLWKFHEALMGEQLLSAASKKTMFDAAKFENYALGWEIKQTASGAVMQSHGGTVRGFACELRRYPETNSCVIVLSNRDDAPCDMIANVIESLMFAPKMPDALPAEMAAKFVGEYTDAKGRLLKIELIEQHSTYAIYWGPGNPSAPVSRGYVRRREDGTFVMYQPGDVNVVEVKFNDAESQVQSLKYQALELLFERTD